MLIISDNPTLRIPNKRMAEIWGHGFTKTQGVKKIRDIGMLSNVLSYELEGREKDQEGGAFENVPQGVPFSALLAEGVSRTQVVGGSVVSTRLAYPGEIELIYDYEHCKQINKQGGLPSHENFLFSGKRFSGWLWCRGGLESRNFHPWRLLGMRCTGLQTFRFLRNCSRRGLSAGRA